MTATATALLASYTTTPKEAERAGDAIVVEAMKAQIENWEKVYKKETAGRHHYDRCGGL